MQRLRCDAARKSAAARAEEAGDESLATRIRQFQFRDTRPKAASDMGDLEAASKLLGHSDKQITKTVYIRVGEIVQPMDTSKRKR